MSKIIARLLSFNILFLIISILTIIFTLFPPFNQSVIRIPIVLFFLLFIPGYAISILIFPKKKDLTGIERLTLSIVFSIALVIFDGFILNSTPWGFRPVSIIISLIIFTLLILFITFFFRIGIPSDEKFSFDYKAFVGSVISKERFTALDKVLIFLLITSIIIASGIMFWTKLTFPEERFTAFYILGNEGRAENYTTDLYLGRETTIITGIENHEYQTVNYTFQTKMGSRILNSQKITLDHGEEWQGNVSFIVDRVGPKMKLEFLLFKEDAVGQDKSLYLWVASHIDDENLEILKKHTTPQLPEIRNGDMEFASGWSYISNNEFFRGTFLNSTSKIPEKSMIKGYLFDRTTGLPIEDASVRISNHYGYLRQTQTNKDGYYEINAISDNLWFEAWKKGYNVHTVTFNITDMKIVSNNVTLETNPFLKPSPQIPALKGYVTDIVTDVAISNATLTTTNYRGFMENTTTNKNGYFEIMVIPGDIEIQVKADGYMESFSSANVSRKSIVQLKLRPENSSIKGYVLDPSGKPIVNATIHVGDHFDLEKQIYSNETSSDSTGFYSIKTIDGQIWLQTGKEGYFSKGSAFDIVYGETKNLDMILDEKTEENVKVSGYIQDKHNGLGLGNVKVVISDHQYYEKSGSTDSSGYYEIYTVPGNLWLDLNPPIYMNSLKLNTVNGQALSMNAKIDSSPIEVYRISYPYKTNSFSGYYGAIYQDFESTGGIITLSFKVKDSIILKEKGYHFKQVLLNDMVIWEDDVAGDEDWQLVEFPVSLEPGLNRIMLRVIEKQAVGNYGVDVYWDDVRIEPLTLKPQYSQNLRNSNFSNQSLSKFNTSLNNYGMEQLSGENESFWSNILTKPKIIILMILMFFSIIWVRINH